MKTLLSSTPRLCVGLLVLGLAACGDDENGNGTGGGLDGGASMMDGGTSTDMGGGPDMGTQTDMGMCVPETCESLGETCGSFPDGCGSMISCTDGCECTDDDFETTCPQRPCEQLAGCDEGRCSYAPVICANEICQPSTCTGEGCDVVCTEAGCDTGLYPCGGGTCAGVAEYCDPAPTVENGVLVFANLCVPPPSAGCGTCELGNRGCDEASDAFTCLDIAVPVRGEGGIVECDSTVSGSTFLFVDTEYSGGNSDGSRERPYTTYEAARTAALTRSARGIVVAGSPVFTQPLVIEDGISIYGGYTGAPDFDPDPSLRPVWQVGSDHYDAANNRLVGAFAESITRGTVVSHLRVSTADIPNLNDGRAGATNIALFARGASGLHLQDMVVESGAAGAGLDGDDGADPSAALDGGDANGRAPGAPGPACSNLSCTAMGAARITRQDTNQCGHGAYGAAPGFSWAAPVRGNPGTDDGSVLGGAPGANSGQPGGGCNANNSATTPGGPGNPGRQGATGPNGTAGTRGLLSDAGIWAAGSGTDGASGQPGTWGGGGGAGGGLYDDCSNQPRYGGHGGGAGGPGCGGDFGRGGGGGGASVGLAALLSPGLTTESSTVTAGGGGAGGDGGAGKAGGSGGDGETDLAPLCAVTEGGGEGVCQELGGRGGNGGDGGAGGSGGAGAGGDSVAVYCVGEGVDVSGLRLQAGPAGAAGVGRSAGLSGEAGQALEARGCR